MHFSGRQYFVIDPYANHLPISGREDVEPTKGKVCEADIHRRFLVATAHSRKVERISTSVIAHIL